MDGFLPFSALWKRSVKPRRAVLAPRLPWPRGSLRPSARCRCLRFSAVSASRARGRACVRPRLDHDVGDRRLDDRQRDDQFGEGRARRQRPRLGPRPRDEPVGRLRLREARLDATTRSSPTTTRARRSGLRRSRPCASCSLAAKKATLDLGVAVDASPTPTGTKTQLDPGRARAEGRSSRSPARPALQPAATRSRRPQPLSSTARRTAASSPSRATASSSR